MESEALKPQNSEQRAIDIAVWMNFRNESPNKTYEVIKLKKSKGYKVVKVKSKNKSRFITRPTDYSEMTYEQIKQICEDLNPLDHWDAIIGLFCSTNLELLQFIIIHNVPLEKLIRYSLSQSGYDKNKLFVCSDKAQRIWLK